MWRSQKLEAEEGPSSQLLVSHFSPATLVCLRLLMISAFLAFEALPRLCSTSSPSQHTTASPLLPRRPPPPTEHLHLPFSPRQPLPSPTFQVHLRLPTLPCRSSPSQRPLAPSTDLHHRSPSVFSTNSSRLLSQQTLHSSECLQTLELALRCVHKRVTQRTTHFCTALDDRVHRNSSVVQ